MTNEQKKGSCGERKKNGILDRTWTNTRTHTRHFSGGAHCQV